MAVPSGQIPIFRGRDHNPNNPNSNNRPTLPFPPANRAQAQAPYPLQPLIWLVAPPSYLSLHDTQRYGIQKARYRLERISGPDGLLFHTSQSLVHIPEGIRYRRVPGYSREESNHTPRVLFVGRASNILRSGSRMVRSSCLITFSAILIWIPKISSTA